MDDLPLFKTGEDGRIDERTHIVISVMVVMFLFLAVLGVGGYAYVKWDQSEQQKKKPVAQTKTNKAKESTKPKEPSAEMQAALDAERQRVKRERETGGDERKIKQKEEPEPVAVEPKKVDADPLKSVLHERLQTLDREAMELFRKGKKTEGERKIMAALDYWSKSFPPRCTPKESLAVAVLYVRIVALTGKSLPKQKAMGYITSSQFYAKEGGIDPQRYDLWFDDVLSETIKAYENR